MKSRASIVVFLILILSALIVGFVAGPYRPYQRESLGTQTKALAPAPDAISIFYTCDTRGHINPCNCTSGVAGGLSRRKTFIAKQATGDALIVDAGNLTAGGRPWELLELEYILRGYQTIGYHAVNIGKREAGLPASVLADLAKKNPFLISANVTDAKGNLLFPPYRVATLKSGYRAAVLGIVENNMQTDEVGEGVLITSPEEAIAKAIPKAKQEADFVVLLAFADEHAMKALAERFFEISAIVGGDVAQPSGDAETANKSSIVYITDKGKSVGQLDLRYVGGRYIADKNAITMMLPNVADNPQIAELISEFQQKQVDNNYPVKKDDEDGLSTLSKGK